MYGFPYLAGDLLDDEGVHLLRHVAGQAHQRGAALRQRDRKQVFSSEKRSLNRNRAEMKKMFG